MAGPFPGMDPWMENSRLWAGVHTSLITYIRDVLQPGLRPLYVAAIEERVYVSTVSRSFVPDVSVRRRRRSSASQGNTAVMEPDDPIVLEVSEEEVHEPYIEILDRKKQKVVTVIEVLSPSNKRKGIGKKLYLAKQREVLQSNANLVEIDLLRGGSHVLAVPQATADRAGKYDYLVSISAVADRGKRFAMYPTTLRERLPRVAIPLRTPAEKVTLALQPLIDRAYESGEFFDRLDYDKPCIPRLRPDDEAWARERIAQWQAARQA